MSGPTLAQICPISVSVSPRSVQAAQRGCLAPGRGLGVGEGFQQVALYIGAFADGDLAGPAESLQFLPLRGGDEQGFPGQGADLRRRRGAEGPAGCEVKGSLAVLG